MKRILLTGANGRLGSRLAKALLELGYPQIHLSSSAQVENIPGVKYIQVDWQDLQIPEINDVDVIVHLAHQTSAYQARKDVEADIQSNLISTVRIIESVRKSPRPIHFIYMGSLTEYGTMNVNPINESHRNFNPETFYDCSKLAVELYLRQFQAEEVLNTLTLIRLGNLYGFTENPKQMHRGFFDNAIFDAYHGQEVTCYGDGNFLRDFIHVDDLIAGILAFIESSDGAADGMFNLAGGTGHTLRVALNEIGEQLNLVGKGPMRIRYQDFPLNAYSIEKRNHVADISLIKKSINWTPKISLSVGISKSINYYSSADITK